MNSVNISILTGRLGKDPEVRKLTEKLTIAKLSLATDHSWFNKKKQTEDFGEGGWESKTTWHNVVVWNPGKKLIEAKKGDLIHCEGRYEANNYEDLEGKMVYGMQMVAERHWVIPKGGGAFETDESKKKRKDAEPPKNDAPFPDKGPDDLPF